MVEISDKNSFNVTCLDYYCVLYDCWKQLILEKYVYFRTLQTALLLWKREGRNLALFLLKALFIFPWDSSCSGFKGKQNQFLSASVAGRVALHKFNRYFICVGKHTQKYLVSHYGELPETECWRLGRLITIIVVISIVLIVMQEDPDKIQDARWLLKSIGLQTPIYGQLE